MTRTVPLQNLAKITAQWVMLRKEPLKNISFKTPKNPFNGNEVQALI